jgi:hypothetical protein
LCTGVAFRASNGLHGEIILKGNSPTILPESGPHLYSFYNHNLTTIARQITEPLAGKWPSSQAFFHKLFQTDPYGRPPASLWGNHPDLHLNIRLHLIPA